MECKCWQFRLTFNRKGPQFRGTRSILLTHIGTKETQAQEVQESADVFACGNECPVKLQAVKTEAKPKIC